MSARSPLRHHPSADISTHSKCQEIIRRGALVAISSSGGKDSQAMTLLLSRIVPREQLLVIHAPLGEVEWPGTIEHIQSTIPDGVPFTQAPVASGKTLLDRIEERGKFPSAKARFCTSDFYGELTILNWFIELVLIGRAQQDR